MAQAKKTFRDSHKRDHEVTRNAESKSHTTGKSTKTELVFQIATKTKIQENVVKKVLNSLIGSIRLTLEENREIRIPGLGTFSVVESEERFGINPRTRAKIRIPGTKMPIFKASKSLKEAARKAK